MNKNLYILQQGHNLAKSNFLYFVFNSHALPRLAKCFQNVFSQLLHQHLDWRLLRYSIILHYLFFVYSLVCSLIFLTKCMKSEIQTRCSRKALGTKSLRPSSCIYRPWVWGGDYSLRNSAGLKLFFLNDFSPGGRKWNQFPHSFQSQLFFSH